MNKPPMWRSRCRLITLLTLPAAVSPVLSQVPCASQQCFESFLAEAGQEYMLPGTSQSGAK